MAVAIPLAVSFVFELDNVNVKISNYLFIFIAIMGFQVGFASSYFGLKNGPIDNWDTWASLVNNNAVNLIVLLFTLTPLILKATNYADESIQLNLMFYSYWFCGLNFFFFIGLYKLLSPKIYKYRDYDDFFMKSDSFIHLRNETSEIIAELEKAKLKEYEKKYLEEDTKILKSIENNTVKSSPDAFQVLRKRTSNRYSFKRGIVSVFILVPAYLLPTIIVVNISLVAVNALQLISENESFLKALFGN